MKPCEKKNCSRWGLIGLALAFLFAAVPIVMQAAAADSVPHLAAEAEQHRHLSAACCAQARSSREADLASFSKRVSEIRKMLGTDSR